jgi:hypothetical protein
MTTKVLIANFGPDTLGVVALDTPKAGEPVQLPSLMEFEKIVAPGNSHEITLTKEQRLLVGHQRVEVQPVDEPTEDEQPVKGKKGAT